MVTLQAEPWILRAREGDPLFGWDKIEYPSTDQWGSFKAQQKLHFKAFFHAVH